MHKTQRKSCWTLVVFIAVMIVFGIMVSYWYFVPRQLHFWTPNAANDSNESSEPTASEYKFIVPPQAVPKELNLKRGTPFIYQIFH